MESNFELTDDLWGRISPLLPKMKKRKGRSGRYSHWHWRQIVEAIFWVLRTGAQWGSLPSCFPPRSTVHRRYLMLVESKFFEKLVSSIGRDLMEQGAIDLTECFIDGTFVVAKRGGEAVGKTKRGKGSKIMNVSDANGLPVGLHVTSASPHEVTLVEETLDKIIVDDVPEFLIGDGAYDSDGLDERLEEERGIRLVAPHKTNRVKPPTQDGRTFRRYCRRWKVERSNSWLQNYRRVLVRWERKVSNYVAYVQFALADLLVKRLV